MLIMFMCLIRVQKDNSNMKKKIFIDKSPLKGNLITYQKKKLKKQEVIVHDFC